MSKPTEEVNLGSDDERKQPENPPKKIFVNDDQRASGSAVPPEQTTTSINEIALLKTAIHQQKTSKTPSVKGNGPGPVKRHATQTDLPAKKRRHVCSSSKEHVDDDDRDPEELMNEIIDENNGSDPSDKELDSDDPDVDETLAELQKEYESDDTPGAKLQHNQLAKLTDKMLRHRMSDKALKDKLDRQERPENCKNAKPTRVNLGIWRKFRDHTKKK